MEHVEVDDRGVTDMFKTLVNTSLAFGAKRWVGTLDRQCERLASAMANNIPAGDQGGNIYIYIINAIVVAYFMFFVNCYHVVPFQLLLFCQL